MGSLAKTKLKDREIDVLENGEFVPLVASSVNDSVRCVWEKEMSR